MYFRYGETEVAYLENRDEKLGNLIRQIGPVEREVDPDLFSSVVHHIIGQQISTRAQATIWQRMREAFDTVDASAVLSAGVNRLQEFGITFRKAEYIFDFAGQVQSGEFDLEGL